ncbi:MAG: hypothetical protein HC825_09200, partial [Oscillatoriales cyanobacterium RM1_1_9]|nr:hypothetical protein [Oscillatoriales cyanobacterium RM1_1_9]
MRRNVDTVGESHDRVEKYRIGRRGNAQHLVKQQCFYKIIEQRHGKPCIQQGIGN